MTDPRVALVTGGGRGIGAAVSLALAGDGMDIAINYRRDEASARQTAHLVEAMGRRAAVFEASVDDYEADTRMVEAVLAEFGHVDVFVHSAGLASRGNTVVDTDPAEVERLLRTHAIGALAIAKLVIPSMRTRPRGDVVFLSSAVTRMLPANSVPYSMAKAAVEALAHTLAKEERANGIHVNIVAPGLVDTDMGRRLVKGASGVDDIHSLDDRYPFGHVCSPEEVADVVAWVVSDGARYVSDQWIAVNGGNVLILSGPEIPSGVLDIFADKPVAYITTIRPDGHLSTNPVAVLLRDGQAWVSTTKDRKKYRNLVEDPRVTVCVCHRNNPNRYVEIRGRAELVDDPGREVIDEIARVYMGADRYPFDKAWQERVTIVVHAEQISAPQIPLDEDPPMAPDRD